MTRIVWLASYPKSGNTWLRLMLQSYLGGGAPVDINGPILGGRRLDDRTQFDEAIGIAASDLTQEEVAAWWPAAFRDWARTLTQPAYLKTHSTCPPVAADGMPELAVRAVRAIYLVRDPRDVALSLARHLDRRVDDAIRVMGTLNQVMGQSLHRLQPRLPETWGSWSQNVESWQAAAQFPVHVVQYEALRADPEVAFAGVLSALGLPIDTTALQAAVAATALDGLRAQEAAHGFVEWPGMRGFFGEGRVRGWRDRLTPSQVARIEADHGAVMRRLGYRDEG